MYFLLSQTWHREGSAEGKPDDEAGPRESEYTWRDFGVSDDRAGELDMLRKAREGRKPQPSAFALERLPRLRKEDLTLFEEDVGAFAFRFFDLMFPREAREMIAAKVRRGIKISSSTGMV